MTGIIRRSALTDRTLKATLLALSTFDRDTLKHYRTTVRGMAGPAWKNELPKHARTTQDTTVLVRGATTRVSNQNVTLTAGSSTRKMKGGGRPKDIAKSVEFGSPRGTKQFPAPRRGGRVAYAAAARVIPRFASLITQTVMRTLYDAIDGGRRG